MFIYYTIYVELLFYVYVYNLYLVLSTYRLLKAANTILVTNIPKEDLLVLEDIYSIFPSKVYSV